MPTWNTPPSASCARPLACRGRNARPARGSSSKKPVYDALVKRLVDLTNKLTIGDPTERTVYLGPVINSSSYQDFKNFTEELAQAGTILTGGKVLTEGALCQGLLLSHPPWWQTCPTTTACGSMRCSCRSPPLAKVKNLDEAMRYANDVDYGLTAGFYGIERRSRVVLRQHRSRRDLCQPPAGRHHRRLAWLPALWRLERLWLSGKNAGGHYYLPLYMHEQIHTLVKMIMLAAIVTGSSQGTDPVQDLRIHVVEPGASAILCPDWPGLAGDLLRHRPGRNPSYGYSFVGACGAFLGGISVSGATANQLPREADRFRSVRRMRQKSAERRERNKKKQRNG